MRVRRLGAAAALGAAFGATALTVIADRGQDERVLGLWQSNGTYLELNIDGTFFSAQHSAQDDLFGTYAVDGNIVRFTYSLGNTVLTAEKTVLFAPAEGSSMQLVDTQEQSITYQKLRDF